MTTSTAPRYELESRIATGGMGEVWRATDTVLDRPVALKVLKPEHADDPTFRQRFQTEARHAAALSHPNVASVFDFGELPAADGSEAPRPFLVMELVPGQPLSDLLREGEPMPPQTAARLVAQACDAVAAAHAIGVVHRDIKPANLLVTPTGQVKITDFGIARAADAAGLTQTGMVVGTPAYLSPEQAEGRPATAASDVYALGVVLYECLAGRRPFTGDTPVSIALAHVRDEPPALPDSVPAHLRSAVSTAMAKDPEHRFASVAAMAAMLRGDATGAPAGAAVGAAAGAAGAAAAASTPDATRLLTATSPAPPAPPPAPARDRRRPAWWPWPVAAAAVLLGVLLLSWLTGPDDSAPAATPQTASTSAPARPSSSAPAPRRTEAPPAGIEVRAADYQGLEKKDAEERLTALGLEVDDEKVPNPGGAAADTVADVSPTGLLQKGDEVTLYVYDKPAPPPEDDGEGQGKPGKPGKGGDNGKAKGKND